MSDHIVDTDLFQAVFQMVEKESEDSYLASRLKKNADILQLDANTFAIEFKDNTIISIKNDLDVYYLFSTKPNVYCNGEDSSSKLSGDRISFYLNRILDLVMYGR